MAPLDGALALAHRQHSALGVAEHLYLDVSRRDERLLEVDALVAKVIVWDEERQSAIARSLRALRELDVQGVPTTRNLAIDVLRSEEFGSGRYSTDFLERRVAEPARTEV